MYLVMISALMLVLPLLSIGIDAVAAHAPLNAALVLKWFVFWSVGLRLFLAGLRQMTKPEFTIQKILGQTSMDALVFVRELGFANTAMGAVGLASLALPAWRLPIGVAAAIFLGLAGIHHLMQKHRNRMENVAMVSDLFVALVLAGCCLAMAA